MMFHCRTMWVFLVGNYSFAGLFHCAVIGIVLLFSHYDEIFEDDEIFMFFLNLIISVFCLEKGRTLYACVEEMYIDVNLGI